MLIIDGHNLAFADDEARRLLLGGKPEGAQIRIIDLVQLLVEAQDDDALIIFDGSGGGQPEGCIGRIKYKFSGAGKSADAEILRVIRGSSGRRETTLVTSDRELASEARKLGVKVMGLAPFMREATRLAKKKAERPVSEPRAKRTGAPPGEVEYWLNFFSDKDVTDLEKEPSPDLRKKPRKK